jgi:hypothetical protein
MRLKQEAVGKKWSSVAVLKHYSATKLQDDFGIKDDISECTDSDVISVRDIYHDLKELKKEIQDIRSKMTGLG